jgi:predicted nucleic acid-binding protein
MSSDRSDSLIFDASVMINLLATGMAGGLIGLLECPVIMADRTFKEIRRHPLKGRNHDSELNDLIQSGCMKVQELDAVSKDLFFELTSADLSGGLDDGEAAAIALSVSIGKSAVLIIDDRKARNVLLRRWPNHRVLYSIDLFTHNGVDQALVRSDLADAVYSALVHARMRIPAPARSWIEELIGPDRAGACPSLGSRP